MPRDDWRRDRNRAIAKRLMGEFAERLVAQAEDCRGNVTSYRRLKVKMKQAKKKATQDAHLQVVKEWIACLRSKHTSDQVNALLFLRDNQLYAREAITSLQRLANSPNKQVSYLAKCILQQLGITPEIVITQQLPAEVPCGNGAHQQKRKKAMHSKAGSSAKDSNVQTPIEVADRPHNDQRKGLSSPDRLQRLAFLHDLQNNLRKARRQIEDLKRATKDEDDEVSRFAAKIISKVKYMVNFD